MTNANDILNPHYVDYGADDRGYTHDGLTKLEYFSAMAMQGLLSREGWAERFSNEKNGVAVKIFATASINAAKALIAELNKQ